MKITLDLSKKNLKKKLQKLGCLAGILFLLSLPLSFINVLAVGSKGNTCRTYGYYLPVTFVMCHINNVRIEEQL